MDKYAIALPSERCLDAGGVFLMLYTNIETTQLNAQYKHFKTFAVLVYGHIYIIIMVILGSQNKNTYFFMILAWLCRSNVAS